MSRDQDSINAHIQLLGSFLITNESLENNTSIICPTVTLCFIISKDICLYLNRLIDDDGRSFLFIRAKPLSGYHQDANGHVDKKNDIISRSEHMYDKRMFIIRS